MIYLDIDLITLAYLYLQKKAQKTHKQYTIPDLLWTCEKILQKIELINRTKNKINIENNCFKITEKFGDANYPML